MDGACGMHVRKYVKKILVGKPEMKELLGRPRRDNIRMNLGEIKWEDNGLDSSGLG
jgi:hypothetical protein